MTPSTNHAIRNRGTQLWKVGLTTACVMFVFELTKQTLRPNIGIWASHLVTIAFVTLITVILSSILLGKERRQFIGRYYVLTIVILIAGFILTASAFVMVRKQERRVAQEAFVSEAVGDVGAVSEGFNQSIQLVRSLEAHFEATDSITSAGFHAFVQPLLSHYPGVQALEWIPLVTDDSRSIYEKAAQRDFPGFQITERKSQGVMVRAGLRPEYFPVYFVEPYKTNEAALGFDLASNPTRRKALMQARDTGNIVATARVMLVQEKAGQYGFLVFDPVYRKGASLDTAEQRQANLLGFVLGVFRIPDVVETALRNRNRTALGLSLYDESAEQKDEFLYRHPAEGPSSESASQAVPGLVYTATLEIGGRTWLLRVTPGPGEHDNYPSRARLVLLGGIIATLVLATYAQTILGHSETLIATNRALADTEQKYRSIFEEAIIGIWQTTSDRRFLSVNPAMARMFGYASPQEFMAAITGIEQQPYTDPTCGADFKRMMERQESVENFEYRVYRKNGSKMWLSATARAVRTGGAVVRYDGTVQDITGRKLLEDEVQFLAYYDALTGLPNRILLQDRLAKALASARRRREKVALLFLDLDRFKTINDSLGHSVGDLLLKEVAKRLQEWAREQDTVARLGGDEFVVMLTAVKDIADAAVAADRILKAIAAEFIIRDHLLSITCSLGISVFPDHGTDGETLVKNADAAMYSAKEKGRNNFKFFTQEMNVKATERLTLESSLRGALERGELFLAYQPQVDIATGQITGAEALLRWRHPELGLVPPDKFIFIAENSGLIIPIGEWVLNTACAQARQWQDQGLPALTVAVNVSAVQFRQERFLEVIRKVLDETRLPPQYLELELTESLLLSNADVTLSVLQELNQMGVRLSIDDFGTGYSSLSYLRHFPVYKLKIDRSFVRDITSDPGDAAITSTIISMGKSLNLKVIAEGVENEDQLLFLRAHNCDELQGFYFSRPLTPDDFSERLRNTSLLPPNLQAGTPAMCSAKLQLAREALWYSTRNSSVTMELFLLKDEQLIGKVLTTRDENTQKISDIVAKLEGQCNSLEEQQLLATVKDARTPYLASYRRVMHLLIDEKKQDAARAIMVEETTPALFKYHDAWNNFMRLQQAGGRSN